MPVLAGVIYITGVHGILSKSVGSAVEAGKVVWRKASLVEVVADEAVHVHLRSRALVYVIIMHVSVDREKTAAGQVLVYSCSFWGLLRTDKQWE